MRELGKKKKALIVVDVQTDFLPGGNLAVPNGDEIIPVINSIMDKFGLVVATQDWHPANHKSFASNNEGKNPFDMGELGGEPQVMWPDHCVQDEAGSEIAPALEQGPIATIFRKGMDPEVDSYSGFCDNGHKNFTGLEEYLTGVGINEIYVCGLALNYCVKFTALDAKDLTNLPVTVITDACRGLDPGIQGALDEMKQRGIHLLTSDQL